MTENTRPDPYRNWIIWGVVLIVILLLVIAGLLFFPRATTSDQSAVEAPTSAPAQSAPGPDSTPATECPPTGLSDEIPTETPEFEWVDYRTIQLPVSDEYGPLERESFPWTCSSNTPTGAVFAALPLMFAFTLEGESEAAIDSPGARAAANQGGGLDFMPRGFRVVDSTPESTTVSYWAASQEDTSLKGTFDVTVVWDDETQDWKLDLAGGFPDIEPITNTSSYIEWR